MNKTTFTMEALIYVAIAVLTATQEVKVWTWQAVVAVALAGLIVLKAKLATGLKSDKEKKDENTS